MKILVCGSREWTNKLAILRELRALPAGTIVVHGDCRGADKIAGYIARELGFEVRSYPADWDHYGLQAGPIRNGEMLAKEHREEEPIDRVLAFSTDFGPGSGTYNMTSRAEKVGIEVQRISR